MPSRPGGHWPILSCCFAWVWGHIFLLSFLLSHLSSATQPLGFWWDRQVAL